MDWLSFFRIAGYIALAFGVICTICVDYLKNKQDSEKEIIQKERESTSDKKMTELMVDVKESKKLLEPFTDAANKLYPNLNQNEALEKLSNKLQEIDRDLLLEKQKVRTLTIENNTIKTLDIYVFIEFSGKWTGHPYSEWYQPAAPKTFLKLQTKDKTMPDIEFSAARINYKTLNDSTGIFENVLTVQPVSSSIGEPIEILKKYDYLEFWLLFTHPKFLTDPKIRINKFKLVLSLNGSRKGEITHTARMTIDLTDSLNKVDDVHSQLTPSIFLDGKILEAFKIKLE